MPPRIGRDIGAAAAIGGGAMVALPFLVDTYTMTRTCGAISLF